MSDKISSGEAIITALDGLLTLVKFVEGQIEKAKERGEWTPEQEVAAQAKLAEVTKRAHWAKITPSKLP